MAITQHKTPRPRDAERSKAAILLAARQEFVSHGFSGARTNEISKRANVPQGLLYHYFENKEALFGAVMYDALTPYFQATIDLLENPPEDERGAGLLARAIRMYFEFLQDNPHVPRLMAWWIADQGWTKGPPIPMEAKLCATPMALGSERIREAQEAGLLRRDLDPETLIHVFLDLCMHWHMTWPAKLLERGLDPGDEKTVEAEHERRLDHVVEIIIHGVRPREGRGG